MRMPGAQDRNEDGNPESDVPRLAQQYSHKNPEKISSSSTPSNRAGMEGQLHTHRACHKWHQQHAH